MKILGLILIVILYFLPEEMIEFKVVLISSILIFWIFYVVLFIFVNHQKKNKENVRYKQLNITKIPVTRTPVEVCFLLKGKISPTMIGISIIELIRKKVLFLRYNQQTKDYVFVYNQSCTEELSNSEKILLDWLLKKISNNEMVSLLTIKKEAYENSVYFLNCYHNWYVAATIEGTSANFFKKRKRMFEKNLSFIIISFILVLIGWSINISLYLIGISLLSTLILIIFINRFYLRTTEANEEYWQWLSFGNSIKKGKVSNNIDDLSILKRIVIYTKIFRGKAEKIVPSIMLMNDSYTKDEFIMCARGGIIDDICSKIDKYMMIAIASGSIFSKNKGKK